MLFCYLQIQILGIEEIPQQYIIMLFLQGKLYYFTFFYAELLQFFLHVSV